MKKEVKMYCFQNRLTRQYLILIVLVNVYVGFYITLRPCIAVKTIKLNIDPDPDF